MFGNTLVSELPSFLDGLLPVNFGVLFAFPSAPPFPSPFEFRCGERRRTFLLPLLLGSCMNAHGSPNDHGLFVIQRMQSSPVFCILFAFSFRFPFARSSCCKSVLVSISHCGVRILDFLVEMSLDHELQSAIIILLVDDCRLFSVGLQYYSSSDFSICIVCRHSNMLSVGLSVIADYTSHHFESKA